ncbi:glycosyltransferase [Portibacter marinus]|uniref:glycosyltransferase n=1 Tax=Portibacter marinus TaxID=2898660 RepID=UPI001F39F0A7|nr:glycosyltransferase [Portibacter marinus]
MTGILYFTSILIAFIYIFIITHLWTSWQEIDEWHFSPNFLPDTKVTVIVPFRNETEHLGPCLHSILLSNYPKKYLEIIAVNDHSTDDSISKVPTDVQLIDAEGFGKKSAIASGVRASNGHLIVTTDADCTVGRNWLKEIVSYYEYTSKKFIAGSVALEGKKNVLEYFQIMDTCGTMGFHAAGIHNKTYFLANGANLIFEKDLFDDLKPYENNQDLASGDDIFFINSVAKADPEVIGFLKSKDSVVSTTTVKSWTDLWKQRKRWATKTHRFSYGLYKWMTACIWILSISIIINAILIPFTNGLSLFVMLTQLLIKGIMDYLYLQNMCHYFGKEKTLKYFIPAFFIQTIYIAVAGLFTFTKGNYEWKGRMVK